MLESTDCGSFALPMSKPSFRNPGARWLVVAAATLGLTGCATVKPSQRETLSKPEMNPATEGLEEQFQSHVESAREGGFGGHGAAGGGCGCG